jgi:Glycosyltransferase Family 4/Glycosyl transferases group 1
VKLCCIVEDIYPTLARGEDANGRAVLLTTLGKGLAGLGHEVSYVTMDYGQHAVERINGCTVYKSYKPEEGIPGLRFVASKAPKVLSALRRANADIYLHMCPDPMAGVIAWYCKRHGKRFIYYGAHDYDFDPKKWKTNVRDRVLFRYSMERADIVLCQNVVQKRTLRENYGRQGEILYNPLDSAERSYNRTGKIVWMAKYYPVKRPEMFIRLSKTIRDRFVMIGGKPPNMAKKQYDEINAQADNMNIEIRGKLDFPEADAIVAKSKLLVSTSQAEGLPNAFLQAWRRGIPVVAFVDPDEMISKNKLGVVVHTYPELVEAVERMRKGISEGHSREIKAFFDRTFATEKIVKRFEDLVERHS